MGLAHHLLLGSATLGLAVTGGSARAQSNSPVGLQPGSQQTQSQQNPSSHVAAGKPAKPAADEPKEQHLLGDWNKTLSDKGLDLTVKYEGDVGAAVSGGKRRGIDYAQQVELNLQADWGKIAGVKGLTSTVSFVNRAGNSVAHSRIGDQLFQVETVYGGTDHAAIHLVQAFLDWKSAKGKVDVAAGRLPVGNDFGTSPYYCEFMNTAICGYPNSLSAKRGFTVFPNSTWGARLRFAPSSKLYIQGGAYQVRPKFGGKYGFDWGWSGTTGTYFPVEVGWEPSFGPNELNGHYKLGFTSDTSRYADNLYDVNGVPFPLSGRPPAKHGGRHSVYVLADQMIHRNGEGPENGLVVLGGYVASDSATSKIDRFAFAAVRDQGLIPGRPDDLAGVMLAHARISNRLTSEQAIAGEPIQTAEWALEGMYKVAATSGLSITPDIQYLIHPNGQTSIRNALALALRVQVTM